MDDFMEKEHIKEPGPYQETVYKIATGVYQETAQAIADDVARYLRTNQFIPEWEYEDILMKHCDAAIFRVFQSPLVANQIIKLAMEENGYERFKKEDRPGADLAVSETREQMD